ncbi:lymphotoxin-beta isoform X1 [Peromyscus californicus insignis]|uniref:lymphotoxin-beta isoform X1 n=1 Tax=Peromyscus californicus insignis TaxID=564181 RepID=UPI0022A7B982|nr:lymphotoxin-beta isoform X1 [Peromyscus californicus insignis]
MGARGLQGPGGRPQGRGCLLLAVAGATSLVTLLLAVPITVLAVLALVPQDQARRVERLTGSGAQARKRLDDSKPSCLLPSPSSLSGTPDSGLRTPISSSSGNLGSPSQGPVAQFSQEASARVTTLSPAVDSSPDPGVQQLPKGEPETDLSPELPAAHLIGAWMSGQRLGWEASQEEAFLRSGVQFSGTDGLALPRDGVYYLYCHVGYRGRAPPAGRGRARSLTLRSALYRTGGAYGRGSPELLLEGAETVTPAVDPVGYRSLWYTSVGFGGLVQIRSGERVYVNISHPDMVDSRRGKTFFGAVMVG